MLEQAKRGELTGFLAVSFRESGGADQWGWMTREEDIARAATETEALHKWTEQISPGE